MSNTTFGKKADELVKEIASSIETSASPSSIPPYNEELVRSILEEVKAHYGERESLGRKFEQVNKKLEQHYEENRSLVRKLEQVNKKLEQLEDSAEKMKGDSDTTQEKIREKAEQITTQEKIREKAEQIVKTEEEEGGILAAIHTHHHSILRNKKALMIYLNERVKRIQSLRWTRMGVGLPDSISENLSHSERDYFTEYSAILNKYMGKKEGINMNLTLDRDPPKELKVQVKCTKDYGEIYTKDGVVDLKKDTVHLLWREVAQPLISEGVLEKWDDA